MALLMLGVLVAVAGGAAPRKFSATPLTPDSTYVNAKSASGSLAETDPSLLGRTDSAEVNVLIKYDFDATASYAGGVAGLEATSPAVTGKKLKANRGAVRAYEQHTDELTNAISSAVRKAVPNADIRESFRTVYGGVAARVPANEVADLLAVDGVVAVQRDKLEEPQTDATPEFIGATDVWPTIGGSTNAASNVVVGVIDSGIWPEHPSFADNGLPAPPGGPYGCEFGDGTDVADLGPTFTCNDKLVGAYAFTDTYLSVFAAQPGEYCNNKTGECSARDADGHGTHTSSTAAGDAVASAPIFGIDRGPISGIAPGARVIMYRVCLEEGCFGSDSVAAIQQAIDDDVDVINYSISGGGNPYTDATELAFLDAFNAGISVNASAGNEGPGAGTADHGGPWVTTVGASSSPRQFSSTIHLHASNGDAFDMPGSTLTLGIGATPIVLATALAAGNVSCDNAFPAGAAKGLIVACEGNRGRAAKGLNVKNAGGLGVVLYNPTNDDTFSDNHWLPAIHLNGPSASFTDFISSHTGVTATWAAGEKTARQPDVMTNFSSRGPLGDFIKPDVTAPGIQILAGNTPTPISPAGGPPGELFQAIAGTSMSSPHAAGVSALVKAAHPDWTPAMIKSAMMTSAERGVVNLDGSDATPFDDGAGSLRVNRAVNPTLVFDETFEHFVESAGDPLHRIDLNLASVNAPTMTGLITTRRTAINVTDRDQELEVEVDAPDGVDIIVSDKAPREPRRDGRPAPVPKEDRRIHLRSHRTTDIWITISAPEVAEGQYFGRITLDPRKHGLSEVTIPVAFVKKQGIVTLTHDCAPTTFPKKKGVAHCLASVTNFSSIPADVGLTVTNLDRGRGLDFTNISAPASSIRRDDGVQWSGSLAPAVPPQIASISPTVGPAGGYLPLSLFGIDPVPGIGDETLVNFNVPQFYFGGEPYTQIGVVSNGYLVVGGGTGADIDFVPQAFPDTTKPNNVIAPLWTDLNPEVAGAIRVGALSDGADTWLVVDYAGVQNYANTTTHTFQVWIRLDGGAAGTGPASEQTTMTYASNANAGSGDPDLGSNWGAENRDGTSGQNIPSAPANGSEYAVNTSPPAAGGSATVTYDASSRKAGTYKSVAGMTSNLTPGTTQVVETLTVTR